MQKVSPETSADAELPGTPPPAPPHGEEAAAQSPSHGDQPGEEEEAAAQSPSQGGKPATSSPTSGRCSPQVASGVGGGGGGDRRCGSAQAAEATSPPAALAEPNDEEPEAKGKTGAARRRLSFNASHCMYDCIIETVQARGWRVVRNEAKAVACNVHWIDNCGISDWFRHIKPWMRINHFPGMHNTLARKSRLAKNMSRMQRLFPKEYNFLPEAWVLPDDMSDLEKRFDENGESKHIYISKPDAGTQGRGIFLTNTLDRIKQAAADRSNVLVVQRYLMRPMLIDGMKFDLRLYFLLGGILVGEDSLVPRYYLFKDGLVRLCTTEYVPPTTDNLDQKRMHLTNYAINKKSKDFVQNDGDDDGASGHKRSLAWFMEYIAECHGEQERDKLWTKLKGLCVKMALAVHPTLEQEYFNAFPKHSGSRSQGCRCFEVLGVDVMLDWRRHPVLIEINHLPSFTCDSPLDEDIKSRVVQQTLELAFDGDQIGGGSGTPKEKEGGASAVLQDVLRHKDFERVYPPPPTATKTIERYEAILSKVNEVFRPVVKTRQRAESPSTVATATTARSSTPPHSSQGRKAGMSSSGASAASSAGASAGLPPRPPQQATRCKPPSASSADSSSPALSYRRSQSLSDKPRRRVELPTMSRSTTASPSRVESSLGSHSLRRSTSREASPQARQPQVRQPQVRQTVPLASINLTL